MSLLDSLGETLGGLTDSVLGGGEQLIDSWFDNEAEKVASAAPEENRPAKHQEPAQQPNGQPVHYGMSSTNALLLVGGGVTVLMVFMLLMRGK